mmetsp:Transcript_29516/g.60845  ORF Transcript_29516/g.60845 Transcript_29516/m.60845 type:complete len:144 (+) Transcript_29516:92-523(+)
MRYFLRPSRSRGRSTQHLRCDVVGSTAHSYQVYWVDTQIRGRQASDQGPCWAQQKARAASAAALGQQRGGRRQRRRALQTVAKWLIPWDATLREHMPPTVAAVAANKRFSLLGDVEEADDSNCRVGIARGPFTKDQLWQGQAN